MYIISRPRLLLQTIPPLSICNSCCTLIQWYWWNQELEDEEKQKKKQQPTDILAFWETIPLHYAEICCTDALWRKIWWVNPPCAGTAGILHPLRLHLSLILAVAKSPIFHSIWTQWPFVLRTKARNVETCFPGAWMMFVMQADASGAGHAVSALGPKWLEHPRVL